jgi:hypothetical protein
MPVTAKLSQRFYQVFGDDVTNELVEWFNQVDATYRADLRELNELNFARFDAKVEQRFAESDLRFEKRFAEFEGKWERRFAELDAKWEKRLAELDAKWEARFGAFEVKWTKELADFQTLVIRQFGRIETQIADLRSETQGALLTQTRWMVGIWATIALAVLGLYLR